VKDLKYGGFLNIVDNYYQNRDLAFLSREDLNALWYQFLMYTYKSWDVRKWAKHNPSKDGTIDEIAAKKELFQEGCSQIDLMMSHVVASPY